MRLTLISAALCAIALAGCGDGDQRAAPARTTGAPPQAEPVRAPAAPGEVRVRTVALFSSGVGYIEHAGEVDGDARIDLGVRVEQLDDILKSLLVEDLDGGHAGVVEYPSLDPLEKTLASFQVDLAGSPTLAQLLTRLRGAPVSVLWQDQRLAGTILGVESRRVALGDGSGGDGSIERWVLDLSDNGVARQIPLDEAREVRIEDARLRDELTKALAAIAVARDREQKTLGIGFTGAGKRRVRYGYVVETPVWKTSYRLVMPAKKGDDARIQGWAIVENQTDQDWTDVRLSLVSGRPISFRQNLSQPLYVPRPVVEPELFASLRPPTHDGGLKTLAAQAEKQEAAAKAEERDQDKDAAGLDERLARPAEALEAVERWGATSTIDAVASVAAAAAADKLGELFHYTVPSVTLPRQRSAMLPIVTDPIAVERVSIFNQETLATHPLDGALVTNTTGKHLLQGPITVLDGGSYAGDASIEDLPPGDHHLISYAIDIPVKAEAERMEIAGVASGKILDGALSLSVRRQSTQTYRFENGADEDRTIVVEHPLRAEWTLSDKDPQPFERTPALYRWKLAVPAGKKTELAIHEEQVEWQSIALTDLDLPTLESYQREGAIPAPVKAALAKAADMRRTMAATQKRIDELQAELAEIAKDQDRLRENMRTVRQDSDYYRRLLAKLNDQETRVEAEQGEIDKQRAALDEQRKQLEDYLASLRVE